MRREARKPHCRTRDAGHQGDRTLPQPRTPCHAWIKRRVGVDRRRLPATVRVRQDLEILATFRTAKSDAQSLADPVSGLLVQTVVPKRHRSQPVAFQNLPARHCPQATPPSSANPSKPLQFKSKPQPKTIASSPGKQGIWKVSLDLGPNWRPSCSQSTRRKSCDRYPIIIL
jgi:hypothetical protein